MVEFFTDALGYRYLGDGQERAGNSNIDEDLLSDWLRRRGNDDTIISRALDELQNTAAIGGGRTLYDANREVYELLRYGVGVLPNVGELTRRVRLIDWDNPSANDFAIAEEVMIGGQNRRRPDIVLYVNGIALGSWS